jgi:hypothetical protein
MSVKEKIDALVNDLGMPEGYKPPKKDVVASSYKYDKEYTVPGEITAQLRAYETEIITGPVQVRNYVTNKLIEISGCGDVKHELKALELLGKINNVGLFSEHSEITVKHTTSGDLEAAIKARIKTLLNDNTIDITPDDEEQEGQEQETSEGPLALLDTLDAPDTPEETHAE